MLRDTSLREHPAARGLRLLAILLVLGAAGEAEAAARGRLVEHTVEGPSLQGNLLGVPAARSVLVYLPPSYESASRRFPSIYVLHGIMDANTTWTRPWADDDGFATLQDLMDRGIGAGTIREMILVIPDADKTCHYTDSPVKGNWETFIAGDLVEFIDNRYRTIPAAASRGIMGHSMGGHGALKIAMKRPGTFGVAYGLNPSIVTPRGPAAPAAAVFKVTSGGRDTRRSRQGTGSSMVSPGSGCQYGV